MSARVTALVWARFPEGGGQLLLALALADQCTDAGEYIAIDIPRLSKKTRLADRTVREQLRALSDQDWLQQMDGSKAFRINPEWVGGKAAPAPERAVKAVAKRGARLPSDWILPADLRAWSMTEFPAWTAEWVAAVAERFKDHWTSSAGQNASKVDWSGAWRNWCRKEPAVPPAPVAGAQGVEWWTSNTAIETKGAELGVVRIDGELWPQWRDRVFQAAGDGPWLRKMYRAPNPDGDAFKPAGRMAAELAKMKQMTNAS